ncbi:DUF1697 domain-containing protein [Kineosporia sp. NBRC 101731]|uniref:DUF1697 domain-containing protein n=1 Tax=Kineosporia sp. NBRC 101731 TaxID=3032199 RepID=UPI0024A2DAD9|nr:DUF1697 domain-containing protein [Kineosporia sp. NBRC 101731]GLY33730.1 hypothetical protein Kisp02_70950 [Kineosporia sp. NBRC 101731]
MSTRLALLLRGVNLGGSRKLAMADLRSLLTELGHTDVSTILASGQAVVTTSRDPLEVAAELEARLLDEAGLRTEVMVRTGPEMARIVAANPFPTADADGARHAVVFLRGAPGQEQLTKLGPAAYAPDECVAHGTELYLRLPNGFADSKLAIAVGKVKGVPATTRNWNTVKKLTALTA